MNELERTTLLTACAFAKVFLTAADLELRGGPTEDRIEAQEQLKAAIMALEFRTEAGGRR